MSWNNLIQIESKVYLIQVEEIVIIKFHMLAKFTRGILKTKWISLAHKIKPFEQFLTLSILNEILCTNSLKSEQYHYLLKLLFPNLCLYPTERLLLTPSNSMNERGS